MVDFVPVTRIGSYLRAVYYSLQLSEDEGRREECYRELGSECEKGRKGAAFT